MIDDGDPLVNVPVRDVLPNGVVVEERRTFSDQRAKMRFIATVAMRGSFRTDWHSVSALMRREGITSIEDAHRFVRDSIMYANEPREMLETGAYIAREKFGDCDGQGALLGEMIAILGHSAALVPMGGTPEESDHLGVMFARDGRRRVVVAPWMPHGMPPPRGWTFAETTIRAALGELPIDAHMRLGGKRADLR